MGKKAISKRQRTLNKGKEEIRSNVLIINYFLHPSKPCSTLSTITCHRFYLSALDFQNAAGTFGQFQIVGHQD